MRSTLHSRISLLAILTLGPTLWLPSLFASPTGDPTQNFIHLLIHSHRLPLDAQLHPGCTKDKGKMVGDYLSFILARAVDAASAPQLEVQCPMTPNESPFPPSKGKIPPQECRIKVTSKDSSGFPQTWALTVRLTRNGRGIERKYIACDATKK